MNEVLVKDSQATIITVRAPGMPFPLPVRYPFIPNIGDFNAESVITRDLQSLPLAFVSSLTFDDTTLKTRNIQKTVLARTSRQSWLQQGFFFLDPTKMTGPTDESSMKSYDVIASMTGSFKSYFAETGKPAAAAPADGQAAPPVVAEETVKESAKDARIVVLGTDSPLQVRGKDDPSYVFTANAVDWLAADTDMISIRSKKTAAPPLGEISDYGKATLKSSTCSGCRYWLSARA